MSRFDRLRMSPEERREAMRVEFYREIAKYERAKQQFVLLENKADRLPVRGNNAVLNHRRSFRYSFRLQYAVVNSMQNLFFEYSRVKQENMDNLYSRLKEIQDAEIAAEAALAAAANDAEAALPDADDEVVVFGTDDVDDQHAPEIYEDVEDDDYQESEGHSYDDDDSLNSLDYAFLDEEDDFTDSDSEDYSDVDDDEEDSSSDESIVYEGDTAYPDSEYDIYRVKLLALERRTERIEAPASDDEELDISLD